jgi:hypothetical protein
MFIENKQLVPHFFLIFNWALKVDCRARLCYLYVLAIVLLHMQSSILLIYLLPHF